MLLSSQNLVVCFLLHDEHGFHVDFVNQNAQHRAPSVLVDADVDSLGERSDPLPLLAPAVLPADKITCKHSCYLPERTRLCSKEDVMKRSMVFARLLHPHSRLCHDGSKCSHWSLHLLALDAQRRQSASARLPLATRTDVSCCPGAHRCRIACAMR